MNTTTNEPGIYRKIEALLRLASNNPNEAEASAAAAKVSELLARYNLSLTDSTSSPGLDRGAEVVKGGFYTYERQLVEALATLNFCMYFTVKVRVERTNLDTRAQQLSYEAQKWRTEHQHKLVGRAHNVFVTKSMADYILGTAARLCQEQQPAGTNPRSRWAVSFREGLVHRVIEKIQVKRREMEREEEDKAREAATRAAASQASTSAGNALTIFTQSEYDANMDFLHGEGYSARRAAQAAKWEQEWKVHQEQTRQWALDHPEEAAAQEAKRAAEYEKYWRKHANRRSGPGSRGGRTGPDRDWSAYRAGTEAGEDVGLDPQVNKTHVAGRLR